MNVLSVPDCSISYEGKRYLLTAEDVKLLRLAQQHPKLYSSDNESKWDRLLSSTTGLLEAVPNQGVDWYGGWVQLSDRGRAFLERLDRLNPQHWSRV